MSAPSQPPAVQAGGGAAKVGDEYEDLWTQSRLLDMVVGQVDQIWSEPPGTAGVGIEFRLRYSDGIHEWHQVKHLRSGAGRWTVDALSDVLAAFAKLFIADEYCRCWFVSAHAAHPLDVLCADAGQAPTLQRFKAEFATSKDKKAAWQELIALWKTKEPVTYEWLGTRLFTTAISYPELERNLNERCRAFFPGKAEHVRASMKECLRRSRYNELDRSQLIAHLQADDHFPHVWTNATRKSVEDSARSFHRTTHQSLVGRMFQGRNEVGGLRDVITGPRPPKTVLLLGREGCGKTAALGDIVAYCLAQGIPNLAVDARRLDDEQTLLDLGTTLGLEAPPTDALAMSAQGKPAILAIDAVDQVGMTRDGPIEHYILLLNLMQAATAHDNITLLMTCRSEDLDTDSRLRELAGRPDSYRVLLPLLTDAQVAAMAEAHGSPVDVLDDEQKVVLRNPFLLSIFTRTFRFSPQTWRSRQDLIRREVEWNGGAA